MNLLNGKNPGPRIVVSLGGPLFAGVTQLVECQFSKLIVAGSSPVSRLITWSTNEDIRRLLMI